MVMIFTDALGDDLRDSNALPATTLAPSVLLQVHTPSLSQSEPAVWNCSRRDSPLVVIS